MTVKKKCLKRKSKIINLVYVSIHIDFLDGAALSCFSAVVDHIWVLLNGILVGVEKVRMSGRFLLHVVGGFRAVGFLKGKR